LFCSFCFSSEGSLWVRVLGVNKTSYDLANRVFSMVILQVHVALLWGAVGRRYRGYTISGSVAAVVLAVAVSQILIFSATAISYIAGVDTLFTFPEALNQKAAVPFGAAIAARTVTFIANCVLAAIAGVVGWFLGGLLPESLVRMPAGRRETFKA
jgi:hypothetical protein